MGFLPGMHVFNFYIMLTELLLFFAMSARVPEDDGHELAALIRDGDKEAFRRFFDLHQSALMRFLRSRNIPQETAEDLVQQAFLTLWDKRANIDVSKSLRSFLFTVAYNRMLNTIRNTKGKTVGLANTPDESDHQTPETQAMASEAMQAMHLRLAAMPEKRRTVFDLCYLQGLSHKEISEVMDISTKTVENHMAIALRELRESLKMYME
ncbi:MAG: RNA polymerase sigma-70 factor [Balneolales bacterium]|nr:RNA polymerase sigma-70 factor [Balneolales bacterium]